MSFSEFLHTSWRPAWLFTVVVLLQPALGSVIFLLIHRMTRGQWGDSLRPQLRAGARLLPWVWLLLVPLLVWPGNLVRGTTHDDASLALYFSLPLRAVRYVVTLAVLAALARAVRRPPRAHAPRWLGPVGLISLVLVLHLAAVDWLVMLQPGWYSTGFPLVWMAGCAVSGLAAAVAGAIHAGRSPAATGTSGRAEGIDWGNLMIAAVMFWAYVDFTHFLIIWMGNLSSEITWYVVRATPGWQVLAGLLALTDLAVPLLLLFFRRFKRSPRGLARLGVALVLLQAAHASWLILPGLAPAAGVVPAGAGAAVALLLFFHRYTRFARAPEVTA